MRRPYFAFLFTLLFLLVGIFIINGFARAPQQATPPVVKPVDSSCAAIILVDNFEDGDFKIDPDWWQFDALTPKIVEIPALGKYSLSLSGTANNWYVGGMGAYIAKGNQDIAKYSYFVFDLYGFSKSGTKIVLEFFDDDNGNWQIEQDPAKMYAPIFDDKFSYETTIDFEGWKQIKIPLSDLVDVNPGVGDDVWNPEQVAESGGLLQMQLIVLSPKKNGEVKFIIDNLHFTGVAK